MTHFERVPEEQNAAPSDPLSKENGELCAVVDQVNDGADADVKT